MYLQGITPQLFHWYEIQYHEYKIITLILKNDKNKGRVFYLDYWNSKYNFRTKCISKFDTFQHTKYEKVCCYIICYWEKDITIESKLIYLEKNFLFNFTENISFGPFHYLWGNYSTQKNVKLVLGCVKGFNISWL